LVAVAVAVAGYEGDWVDEGLDHDDNLLLVLVCSIVLCIELLRVRGLAKAEIRSEK
jgi:hypothetical protein